MAPWPILENEFVPVAHAPSTCCMCATDIPQEDLENCWKCYRCSKNMCEACCNGYLDDSQVTVSSMFSNNLDEYEASDVYYYCEPKCRALHHWYMAARRYTEDVQWRTYQHLLTLKPYALSWKRQEETHPGWNLLWENFEALLEPHVIPPVNTDFPSLRGHAAVIAARIAAATVTNASHIVADKALDDVRKRLLEHSANRVPPAAS